MELGQYPIILAKKMKTMEKQDCRCLHFHENEVKFRKYQTRNFGKGWN